MIDVLQIGKRRNYIVARMLSEKKMLNALYTDYSGSNSFFLRLRNEFLSSDLLSSMGVGIPERVNYYKASPLYYYQRAFSSTHKKKFSTYQRYIDNFQDNYISISRKSAQKSTAIYSFNGSSLKVFKAFPNSYKILDMTSFLPLDEYNAVQNVLSNPKYKNIEMERFNQDYKMIQRLNDIQIEEIKLADRIICLSSDVKDSILNYYDNLDKKIRIINHATQLNPLRACYVGKVKKIVFIGRVNIDKGFHLLNRFLLEHPKIDIKVDVIGVKKIKNSVVEKLGNRVNFFGHLSSKKINEILPSYDLMVFPSVVGGLGMACYESLSHGVPVLTSKNELLDNNINSFTFESGDYESFKLRLLDILSLDEVELNKISIGAHAIAKSRSFDDYVKEFNDAVSVT